LFPDPADARSRENPLPAVSVTESVEPKSPITISFAFRDVPPVAVGGELLLEHVLPEAGCPETWSKALNVLVGSAAPAQAVTSPIAAFRVDELRVTVIDSELILPFALPTHSVSVIVHDPPGVNTFLAEASKVTPVADTDETVTEAGFVITRTIITSGLFVVAKDAIASVFPEVQLPVLSAPALGSNVGLEPITTV